MRQFTKHIKGITAASMLLFAGLMNGQITPSASENYIYVQEPTEPVNSISSGTDAIRSIQYFDGLGRPKQSISVQGSPNGSDLVVPIEYDGFGRQVLDFLPVPISGNNGQYNPNVNGNYYSGEYNTSVWYSEKTIENSPLNRILKHAAPGDSWAKDAGHEIEFQYLTNQNDEVRMFKVNQNNGGLVNAGYYPKEQLYKTVTKDENGNRITEFKDKQGRVVLKRSAVEVNQTTGKPPSPEPFTEFVDTYYVYDIYGNLTYVIPPLAAVKSNITSTVLNDLCYQYKYDERNRLVEKKLPGKGTEFMVYDKQDRLVATQDANLSSEGKWLFTKYDQFGRVVYTGIYGSSANRDALQTTVNGFNSNNETRKSTVQFTQNGLQVYYTKTAFPTTFSDVLTVNYYDKYVSLNVYGFGEPESGYYNSNQLRKDTNGKLKGMATETHIRILGTNLWEKSVTFYDQKSRPVRTYKRNHLGGYTDIDSKLNFRGLPEETTTRHFRDPNAIKDVTVKDIYTYDSMERLLTHTQQINSGTPQLIAKNEYDATGQLITKKVGGTQNGSDRWQEINYSYNIRGWLTGINDINGNMLGAGQLPGSPNDGLFAFKINYDKIDNHGNAVSKLYNGNISQTFWKSGDNTMRGYDYSYDMLNRLRNADYFIQGIPSYTGAYQENIGYDLNGNITELFRTMGDTFGNAVNMDILTYHYKNGNGNSNQLHNVSDAASLENSEGFVDGNTSPSLNDYEYDENGNMIKDRNKGITNISYNHLNLPVRITISSLQFIDYQYNAAGVKVSKTVTDGDGFKKVDYQDGFQSRKLSGAGEVLQFFPTAGGYVSAIPIKQLVGEVITGYTYKHIFHYTDHLGNVRLSFSTRSNGRLEVMNENHYYPFGMKHSVYVPLTKKIFGLTPGEEDLKIKVVTKTDYLYEYNGKELQDELNLNLYDYHARNYDPAIGRWINMDPLAEDYLNLTPFNYVANNPIIFNDPDGMKIIDNEGIVKRHKENLNNSNTELKNFIKSGAISEEIGNVLINANNNALSEINSLEKSSQEYNVFTDNSIALNEGRTFYNYSSRQVMIGIGGDLQLGVIGHELNHGYQFEKGEISFITNNSGFGALYDLGDEREAYNRQFILENGINYKQYLLNNNSQVSSNFSIYSGLPITAKSLKTTILFINFYTKEGKSLRKSVMEAGKNGVAPKEVYINWEKDYEKGKKMR